MKRTQLIHIAVSPEEYERLAARVYAERPPKRLHGRLNISAWVREKLGLLDEDDGPPQEQVGAA